MPSRRRSKGLTTLLVMSALGLTSLALQPAGLAAEASADEAASPAPRASGGAALPEPTTVFWEDFENGMDNTPTGARGFTTYGGAVPYVPRLAGSSYDAADDWRNGKRCNGIVLSYLNETTPLWAQGSTTRPYCNEDPGVQSYNGVRTLARAMGGSTAGGATRNTSSPATPNATSPRTGRVRAPPSAPASTA